MYNYLNIYINISLTQSLNIIKLKAKRDNLI